ncbi:hypothetical protein IAR55_003234 [Kwoniella newhampshirensis]|uniref:Uncharacterized protein n=1 Tax=Kwoniella newhampshirensis TaxID=1651941 RepID=A0AAW0YN70_9TREE
MLTTTDQATSREDADVSMIDDRVGVGEEGEREESLRKNCESESFGRQNNSKRKTDHDPDTVNSTSTVIERLRDDQLVRSHHHHEHTRTHTTSTDISSSTPIYTHDLTFASFRFDTVIDPTAHRPRQPLSSAAAPCQTLHPIHTSADGQQTRSKHSLPRLLAYSQPAEQAQSQAVIVPTRSSLPSASDSPFSARRPIHSPFLSSTYTGHYRSKMSENSASQEGSITPQATTPRPRPDIRTLLSIRANQQESPQPVPIASAVDQRGPTRTPTLMEDQRPSTGGSPASSQIATPLGSMSMSQRRGNRPSFPNARTVRAASQTRGTGGGGGGLPTPQPRTAGIRQVPYPSPRPLLSAPLEQQQTPRGWHQSAPAAPQTAYPSSEARFVPDPHLANLDEIPKDFVVKQLIKLAPIYWHSAPTAEVNISELFNLISMPFFATTPRPPGDMFQQIRYRIQDACMIAYNYPIAVIPWNVKNTANGNLSTDPQDQSSMTPGDHATSTPTAHFSSRAHSARTPQTSNIQTRAGSSITPVIGNDLSHASTVEGRANTSGRRGSLPDQWAYETCLSFPAHRDYLTPQSTMFHTLLNSPAGRSRGPIPRDAEGRLVWDTPIIKGAKVMPTQPGQPKALYVPLPDPDSFLVCLHWMYWHDRDYINHCLSSSTITWQGFVRNIDYLGLDEDIKRITGDWWKRWVKVRPNPNPSGSGVAAPAPAPWERIVGDGRGKVFTSVANHVAQTVNAGLSDDGDEYDDTAEDSGHEADAEEDDSRLVRMGGRAGDDRSTDIVSEQLRKL